MLIASAIKLTTGDIYVGKRHSDCFRNLMELNRKTGLYSEEDLRKLHFNCTQGFINSNLYFLTRAEAAVDAYESSQIDHVATLLLSEDLW